MKQETLVTASERLRSVTSSRVEPPQPFPLLRWFASISAFVIVLIALANTVLVSAFLSEELFQREASVSREFVQNSLEMDGSVYYLSHPQDPLLRSRFIAAIAHLMSIKNVLRANVYGLDRRVLWSSNDALIGKRFADNHDLEEALSGRLVVDAGRIQDRAKTKGEHAGLEPGAAFFVETYIPVTGADGREVLGVVELYRAPLGLTQAIHQGQMRVALTALAGAVLLYASLFWIVRRAEQSMRKQRERLLEAETYSAIGELAASVAHNIRNPLASIRSSAELNLEASDAQMAESARDIVREVDRISQRVTELLQLAARPAGERSGFVELGGLLERCVAEHKGSFAQRRQGLCLRAPSSRLLVHGDEQMLKQAIDSLLDNASDAMQEDQQCEVEVALAGDKNVCINIRDQGRGIEPALLDQVQRPFFSTKPQGLGLGLTLAKRNVERLGGRMLLMNLPAQGLWVQIELPKA